MITNVDENVGKLLAKLKDWGIEDKTLVIFLSDNGGTHTRLYTGGYRGGKVRNNVETVNGAIGLVATQLGGGIQTVNGDITVGIESVVKGGIKIEKSKSWLQNKPKRDPRVIIGPNAVVEGALVFERPVKLYVHKTARIGPVTGATAQAFEGDTAPKE